MARMYISFLLDFFQPTPQSYYVIDEINKECYAPMFELFNCGLNSKFTVSVTNSLIHLLREYGREMAIIESLKRAISDSKVELIHSGAYHPIFPLISRSEVKRQIELDILLKEETFELTNKTGILPPELCYKDELIDLFNELGFKWTIIDDQVMDRYGIDINKNVIYHIDNFYVLMRSSFWSNRIRVPNEKDTYWTGREFVEHLENEIAQEDKDSYKIIAISGETFGHHIKFFQRPFCVICSLRLRIPNCSFVSCIRASRDRLLKSIEKSKEIDKDFTHFPLLRGLQHQTILKAAILILSGNPKVTRSIPNFGN
jgi:hypothetical protein